MAAIACLGFAAVVAYDLYRERGLATQEARANTANLARLLEEHTRQSLRRVELALSDADAAVAQAATADRAGNSVLRRRLQGLLSRDGLVRGFELIDPSGAVLMSVLPPGDVPRASRPAPDGSSAPSDAATSRLGIGALEPAGNGRWSLPVSRSVTATDGRAEGVLVASVDPAYFQPIFDSIDVGTNGFVTLFLAQGRIIATSPANESLFARSWSDAPMFRELLPKSPTGTVQQVVVRDGTERVYSYRALRDYPLVVSIGVSLTDALADWRARVLWDSLLLGVISVLLLGAAAVMARHHARRETAERALAESAHQTQAIVSHVADGIVTIDRHGRIETVNRAAEAIFGHPAPELVGRDVKLLVPSLDRWGDSGSNAPGPELEEAAGKRTETQGRRQDGSLFPLEISVTQTDRAGQALYIGLVRDITERKRLDAELHAQRAALQVMNRELEDFAVFSSHDLQEPLRKIRSFSQLLSQRVGPSLDERSQGYLSYIEEAGGRLQALVRDLLEYSRTSRGSLKLEAVDLKQLADAVVNDLSPAIAEARARVRVGNMPVVQADATQLRLLLQNLLSNALKFRGAQPPEVCISAETDGQTCRLSVRDNGIGIEARYLPAIFKSFRRLHTREQYLGTGLGLAICNRVAERHGGSLKVESTPGRGSVFTLSIPIHAQSASANALPTIEGLP